MKHLTHIEPLEDRIAPALILNPYTVTFQDSDGDTAVVKFSKPLFKNVKTASDILVFTLSTGAQDTAFTGNSAPESLSEINLLGRNGASGMNISVKVIPQIGIGNGQVNVGSIAAANFSATDQVSENISLGNVYVQGDLGSITAGSSIYKFTPAIQTLTVLSMTQAEQSDVLGPIGKLSVAGDFNANLDVIGYQFGSINKLSIGGSLAGDKAGDVGTGVIQFSGHISSATVGSITGGAGNNSGEIIGTASTPSYIGTLHVLGSITGGAGTGSGEVFAQATINKLIVDGSIVGGSGQDSGDVAGPMKTVKIQGSITGGSGLSSGSIFGEAVNTLQEAVPVAIGNITVGGDLAGGIAGTAATISASATPGDTGVISALSAKTITIAGSLIGGTAGTGTNSDGTLDQTADTSGAILVNSAKSITIGKNIVGGSGPTSGVITGQNVLGKTAFTSIVVNGGITGGSGVTSGAIISNGLFGGTIASLRIGGDVTGGTADNSGEILTTDALTNAVIKGSLVGNTSIASSTAVVDSGYIQAGVIDSLDIMGNVSAGSNSAGAIANSGAIRSTANILSLTIQGAVTGTSANPVVISAAQGPGTTTKSKTDLAIKSVTVTGAVSFLDVLAGYGPNVSTGTSTPAGAPLGAPLDGSAQIGSLTFGSTFSASNIVAGALPDPTTGQFGTSGNTAITAHAADIESQIASIVIKGQATGDATPTDNFGIVAEQLQAVQIDGATVPTSTLVPGTPAAYNGTNLFLLEVIPTA